MVDAAFVLGVLALVLFFLFRALTPGQAPSRPRYRLPVSREGRWVEAHYDVDGETRVVLQRVSTTGTEVLDEHVVATVRIEDPEYDARFLAAMSTARERRALFESEES